MTGSVSSTVVASVPCAASPDAAAVVFSGAGAASVGAGVLDDAVSVGSDDSGADEEALASAVGWVSDLVPPEHCGMAMSRRKARITIQNFLLCSRVPPPFDDVPVFFVCRPAIFAAALHLTHIEWHAMMPYFTNYATMSSLLAPGASADSMPAAQIV